MEMNYSVVIISFDWSVWMYTHLRCNKRIFLQG